MNPQTHRVFSWIFTALVAAYVFVLVWIFRAYVPQVYRLTEGFGLSVSFAAQIVFNVSRSLGLIGVSVLLVIALILKELTNSVVFRVWANAVTILLVSSIWLLSAYIVCDPVFEALLELQEQLSTGALVLSRGS